MSLDYEKIKEDISRGTERTVAVLLQALRWVRLLTHSPQSAVVILNLFNYLPALCTNYESKL